MEQPSLDPTDGIDNALSAGAEPAPTDPVSPEPEDPTTEVADSAQQESDEDNTSTRAERRIQQLIGDKKAAKEYGDFWKQRFEELQSAPSQAPEPEPVPAPKRPKLEDFDYDQDAYDAAVDNYNQWVINDTVSKRIQETLQTVEQQQASQQRQATWDQKVQAFEAEHPDFRETAFATQEMFEVIREHENGPEIAYNLGKMDPSELTRIQNLPPIPMAFELQKLVSSTPPSPKPAATPKQATKAPEPLSPVSGSMPDKVPTKDMSIDDWMAHRRQQLNARGR